MSSQQQAISGDAPQIDQFVLATFEKYSGTVTDWGTVIDDELELEAETKVEIAEYLFLHLAPEFEWSIHDMNTFMVLNTAEEVIDFFEGICDSQGSDDEEPMFRFNFG